MADGLTFSGLRDAYIAASPARKLLWGVIILLLLALPAALFWQDIQPVPEYRVLYAELSDRDGGEVVGALERLNIPYRLSDPDGLVLVPSDQMHAARYKLAALGLPRGDKPADASAGQRFGLSSFQEQLGYQRGLEAELARSVETIEAVESARVHLALPKQSSFLREPLPATATVLVELKPGAHLDREQVEAVRRIVAGGVLGMNPSRVGVVDQRGVLLGADEVAASQPAYEEAGEQAATAAEQTTTGQAVEEAPAEAAIPPPPPAVSAQPSRPAGFIRLAPLYAGEERMPVYAGLALSLLSLLLLLRVRARRRRRERDEALAAQTPGPGELFDARLETLRRRVQADPKIAASVIKLWMQSP